MEQIAIDIDLIVNFGIKESFYLIIACAFIFVSVMIDFNTGVRAAKAIGEPLRSHGFRKSIVKFGEYVRVLYFGIVIDCALSIIYKPIPIGIVLVSLAICAIEFYSVIENLRTKKSSAAKIPDVLTQIIKASTREEAKELLNKLNALIK